MIVLALVAAGALAPNVGSHRVALPVPATAQDLAQIREPNTPLVRTLRAKGWTIVYDRRSGEPMLFEGPPIRWDEAQIEATVSKLRSTADRARTLLNDDSAEVDETATQSADEEGTLLYITMRRKERSDSRLTFVVNHGNLVQIHAERWRPLAPRAPKVSAEQAWTKVAMPGEIESFSQSLQRVSLTTTKEPPGIYTGPFGRGYDDHLVWSFRFRIRDDMRTFVAWVDAIDGTLLDLFDDNDYATVVGSIYPRTIEGTEIRVPFALAAVNNNGSPVTTNLGGAFVYSGVAATTTLNGSFISVTDNCGAPNGTSNSAGDIHLGASAGTDCSFSTTGHTTRAARNAVYHLNNVRRMGQKWLSGVNAKAATWFSSNVGINVNIASTCNAYWDGSKVNAFRSGSGCANSGELADAIIHEWGHGLDQNTKSGSTGDEAKTNALGDTMAMVMSHDQCVAPKFLTSGSGGETAACPDSIRDLAYVIAVSNISTHCAAIPSSCSGALGYECHCESHVLSGAYWKLQQSYRQRYGEEEGWNQFEKTFFRSLPNVTAYLANSAGNAYDAWLAADDDNGNVTDGTPNADIVYLAFAAQGIAGTQRVRNVVACPATLPAIQPVLALNNGAVSLSWSAVTNATSYAIFRRLAIAGGSPVFLPLASNLSATSYVDSEVAPGFTYEYEVVATVGGCTTPYGTAASATPVAWPESATATATSSTDVGITWPAVTLADTYVVTRSSDALNFGLVGTTSTTSLADSGLTPNTAYVYAVRVSGGANSAKDIATTVMFDDDPLMVGTLIKSIHITQLRTAVNAVLAVTSATTTYQHSAAPGTPVAASDIQELNAALATARSRIPGIAPVVTPSADPGTPILASQIQAIRNGVK